ncbi:hypothetical protein [Halanaeroarchaeum sp. HSR-CO]|uniref:hypothetical protein n=1 Tax=Halanaeroarchaeum sp. HSR-CO TaxID=2866382 RepID=UPI00217EF725|nr:hypothetical protein [Halanaeroarchaeum sp. HSR-CO]
MTEIGEAEQRAAEGSEGARNGERGAQRPVGSERPKEVKVLETASGEHSDP